MLVSIRTLDRAPAPERSGLGRRRLGGAQPGLIPALERWTGDLAMTKGVMTAAAVAAKMTPFDDGFDRRFPIDATTARRCERGSRDR